MGDSLYRNYEDGKLDEQVRSFLIGLSQEESTPFRSLRPEEVRAKSSILNWVSHRSEPCRTDNVLIRGDYTDIPIRIYSPQGSGPYPVVIYFHGGGWVFGTLEEADHICDSFAREIPAVVVSVDYRLSPENKYPCAIEDAYTAVQWVRNKIGKYNGNPEILGVAGESAGANIATVVCQMLRDYNALQVCYQLLICLGWTLCILIQNPTGYLVREYGYRNLVSNIIASSISKTTNKQRNLMFHRSYRIA